MRGREGVRYENGGTNYVCAGGEMGKQGGVVEQDASASARGREIESGRGIRDA